MADNEITFMNTADDLPDLANDSAIPDVDFNSDNIDLSNIESTELEAGFPSFLTEKTQDDDLDNFLDDLPETSAIDETDFAEHADVDNFNIPIIANADEDLEINLNSPTEENWNFDHISPESVLEEENFETRDEDLAIPEVESFDSDMDFNMLQDDQPAEVESISDDASEPDFSEILAEEKIEEEADEQSDEDFSDILTASLADDLDPEPNLTDTYQDSFDNLSAEPEIFSSETEANQEEEFISMPESISNISSDNFEEDEYVGSSSGNYVPYHSEAEIPNEKQLNQILKWYSGHLDDSYFEFSLENESGEFIGNDEINNIHVNVGNSFYGWNVRFNDGTNMSLRDLRDYQQRYGHMPTSGGVISYGDLSLAFAKVKRIVVYETPQYFSYGVLSE